MIEYHRETNSYSCKELKPCAHCNSVPKIYRNGDDENKIKLECDCGISTLWMEEPELIRVWNTRHETFELRPCDGKIYWI